MVGFSGKPKKLEKTNQFSFLNLNCKFYEQKPINQSVWPVSQYVFDSKFKFQGLINENH
jgi:hypothetical protein